MTFMKQELTMTIMSKTSADNNSFHKKFSTFSKRKQHHNKILNLFFKQPIKFNAFLYSNNKNRSYNLCNYRLNLDGLSVGYA